MKVPFKKPKGCSVDDMVEVKHLHHPTPWKPFYTPQLRYPAGHPMRIYKDKKRAIKNGR